MEHSTCMLLLLLLVIAVGQADLASLTPAVPEWYRNIRVHGHTRLSSVSHYCNVTTKTCDHLFDNAAELLSSVGVRAYVRHSHQGADLNWWAHGPTGAIEPFVKATGRNLPKEFIDKAHAQGMKMILYHYPKCHKYYETAEPSWLNRNSDGSPNVLPRGKSLCINSPWRQVYFDQVRELVNMGVDGLYFDEYPQKDKGCWCEHCQAKFKEWSSGAPFPKNENASNYRQLLEFNSQSTDEYFQELGMLIQNQSAAAIAAGNRTDFTVPLFSTHTLPCPTNADLLFESSRMFDGSPVVSAKIEFDTAAGVPCNRMFKQEVWKAEGFDRDVLVTWGWALGRDSAKGNPGHTWDPATHSGAVLVKSAAAAMVTYGLIANPDHRETSIPDAATFNGTYQLGAKLNALLDGMSPRRWAAVVFNSTARDTFLPTKNETQLWTQVMFQAVGSWETFVRQRVPAALVIDSQITEGNEEYLGQFKVIIVPGTTPSPQQRQVLGSTGASVVQMPFEPRWRHKHQRPDLQTSLMQDLISAVGAPSVQVLDSRNLTQPNATVHAVPFMKPGNTSSQVIMITNQFTWAGERESTHVPPPPVPDNTVIARFHADASTTSAVSAVNGLTGDRLAVRKGQVSSTFELPTVSHESSASRLRG